MRAVLLLVLVACGSRTSPPATAPSVAPAAEPTAPVSETTPAEPATPAKPTPPVEPPAPEPVDSKTQLAAAETAAYEKAKPVFDKWCASCHSKDGKKWTEKKLEHFDMTTYPFGGHHAAEIGGEVKEALGLTGKKPTMPKDKKGAVQGEELALIKAWADAFDAAHPGGHGGHHH